MNNAKYILGIYKAKCNNLLMSSVFVVWLVNYIVELELSFMYTYLSLEGEIGKMSLQKFIQHIVPLPHLYKI